MEKSKTRESLEAEIKELKARLLEAEETLRAIGSDEVDALMVNGPEGSQVFTLQGAEQPYRVFVEAMSEGAATVTPDGTILHCNRRFAEMLKMPLNRIIGSSLHDFAESAGNPTLETMIRECGPEGVRGEALFGPAKERELTVYFSVSPLSREMEHLCVVVTDLTELKRVEKALRESETRYRRLVETAEEGIWVVDSESKTTFVNAKMAEILGYTAEELLGHDFTRFMVEEDRRGAEEAVGSAGHHFTRFTKKDGVIVLCRVSTSPITDDKGNYCGSFAMLTDITEQRRLEDELRQIQKMEAVGVLAGGIAHDFNNILAAIIGFSEIAIEDIPQAHPAHRSVQLVLKSGLRGRDLVKQILAFSRRSSFERKPLSLSPIVKETVRFLRASLPANVEITLKVDSHSPIVLADPTEIQQIVMNLATNASFAIRGTSGQLSITLADRQVDEHNTAVSGLLPGSYVRLTVKDTGTGMDREVMKRIFEPFYTTKGVGEGTGMGLSVVYGIVKSLKGDITVESTPGIGSSFHVSLPRLDDTTSRADHHGRKPKRGTAHVLFVDDEELLVAWGKEALGRLGYTVTALTDSMDALKAFKENPALFDLVLTDQAMPDLTGLEFAEECLKLRPGLPVILCTGHDDTVSPEITRAAGIRTFLVKPLSRTELAEAVSHALESEPS